MQRKKLLWSFAVVFVVISLGPRWLLAIFYHESMPVNRSPQSITFSRDDCNPTLTGTKIQAGNRVPTKTLYHYGIPSLLMIDVLAKQIPLEDWNQFISGSQTRYKLKPFRRGLYGTETPEDADRFSSDKYAGLIAIEVKEECLKSSRISSLIQLASQSKFKSWYESKDRKQSLKEWTEECFNSDGYPLSEKFKYYEPNVTEENNCERVVDQYWTEKKFGIVQDHLVTRSWSIRDRDCIAEINGSPEYWTVEFAKNSDLWRNTCNYYRSHRANIRVWFNALSTGLDKLPAEFNLKNFLNELTPPGTHEDDGFAAQDFSDSFDVALARCKKAKRLAEFKEVLKNIASTIDSMETSDVRGKLERTCW